MKLVHLSDLHFGAVAQGLPTALRDCVANAKPDLVVVSGDLTQKGTRREMQEAKEFLASLPQPQLIIPGNHDMPHGIHLWNRFKHPWQTYRETLSEDLEPSWQNDAMVVAGMNSARPGGWYLDWSRGQLSAGQLIRLRKVYAGSSAGALRILTVHHPPAAPPQGTRRHLIDKRPALFGALNEAGVDLVLSGHFHLSYALPLQLPGTHPRHCVLSVTSTATSHRLQGEPNGFHVIEGAQSHLQISAQTWDGSTYNTSHIWHFRRTEGGDWESSDPPERNPESVAN